MSRRLCFFVTLFLSVANFASAQVTVTTNPVGFTTTTLLGSSDTFVSVPYSPAGIHRRYCFCQWKHHHISGQSLEPESIFVRGCSA